MFKGLQYKRYIEYCDSCEYELLDSEFTAKIVFDCTEDYYRSNDPSSWMICKRIINEYEIRKLNITANLLAFLLYNYDIWQERGFISNKFPEKWLEPRNVISRHMRDPDAKIFYSKELKTLEKYLLLL